MLSANLLITQSTQIIISKLTHHKSLATDFLKTDLIVFDSNLTYIPAKLYELEPEIYIRIENYI